MRPISSFRWATGMVVLFSASAPAASVTTLANLTLMGGQNFFDGKASSVSGNADAVVTPVVKFSDRWSLFPTYHGFYQGTQEIQSLAGGGTLFRDSTGQSLMVKGVRTWGRWKLKPSAGATMEWLRETRDEGWGQGLFDYRKWNGGLEAEVAFTDEVSMRGAYDYYQLDFPNYKSLESAQDPTLSREMAGEDVLNNANHMFTWGVWTPLPGRGRLEATCVLNSRRYGDQPLVNEAGQLTSTKRKDSSTFLETNMDFPLRGPWESRALGQLGLRYGIQNSNQNHFDSNKSPSFQAGYYDYSEWRIAPEADASFDRGRWRMTLGGSWEQRTYRKRPPQNAAGDVAPGKLKVRTLMGSWTLAKTLSPRTKLRFEGSVGSSHSNTEYENVFRYNYRLASYGVGFSYEY